MTRTTRISFTTPNGTAVYAHQTTGLRLTHPWLPTASATARLDLDSRFSDYGTVEANIEHVQRGLWRVVWLGENKGRVDRFSTLAAALRWMGEVAVAELALNPQRIDHGARQHGCI